MANGLVSGVKLNKNSTLEEFSGVSAKTAISARVADKLTNDVTVVFGGDLISGGFKFNGYANSAYQVDLKPQTYTYKNLSFRPRTGVLTGVGINNSNFRSNSNSNWFSASSPLSADQTGTVACLFTQYGSLNSVSFNLCTNCVYYNKSNGALTSYPVSAGDILFRYKDADSKSQESFYANAWLGFETQYRKEESNPITSYYKGNETCIFTANNCYYGCKLAFFNGACYWVDYPPCTFIDCSPNSGSNVVFGYYHIKGDVTWYDPTM